MGSLRFYGSAWNFKFRSDWAPFPEFMFPTTLVENAKVSKLNEEDRTSPVRNIPEHGLGIRGMDNYFLAMSR